MDLQTTTVAVEKTATGTRLRPVAEQAAEIVRPKGRRLSVAGRSSALRPDGLVRGRPQTGASARPDGLSR
jgi:hypothetical protein